MQGSQLELVFEGKFFHEESFCQLQLFPKFKCIPKKQKLSRPWIGRSNMNMMFSQILCYR